MRSVDIAGRRHVVVGVLFALAALAGASTVCVGLDDRQMSPLFDASLRFACATPFLLGIVWAKRLRIPRGEALVGACILAVLNFTLSNGLTYLALREVQPGLAQIIATLNPLFTVAFAWMHRLEPLRVVAILGVLLGAGGVSIAVGGEGSKAALGSAALLVMAMVCSAEGYVLARRFRGLHPITTTAVAMPMGAALLFCWSQIAGESLGLPTSATTILAFAYNVVLGSVGLFGLYFWSLRTWGAVRTSYMFLIAPMVAIALGAVLFHERLNLALVLGSALVLIGVYVGVLRQAAPEVSADGTDRT